MRRDDLYITVPSFFRCPISLDVMKSPVSLCTGVTYDRASIQRWLDGGNNTCPATMQVLQSKEFVPNRTLQRLIQVWSDSVRRDNTADSPETAAAPTRDEINDAVEELRSKVGDGISLEVMKKMVRFAKESDDNRGFLAGKEDLVLMLVDLMAAETCTGSRFQVVEEAVKIMSLMKSKIGEDRKGRLSDLILRRNGGDRLAAIVIVLQRGNVESRIESVRVLETIAIDTESKLMIAEKNGLLTELIKSISTDSDPSLIEASLSCLIAISSPKRVKLALIRSKCVPEISKLLTSTSSSVSVTEKSLKVLETLASCKEGRAEICGVSDAVAAVVRKMMKVSAFATESAVTVLWSVCYLFKDERAFEAVVRSNGVTKILLLLQSNSTAAVRQMLTDLLKVFKVNSRSCLSGYDTKTTHIMPF